MPAAVEYDEHEDISESEEELYIVDRIVAERVLDDGIPRYLVLWEGYDEVRITDLCNIYLLMTGVGRRYLGAARVFLQCGDYSRLGTRS
jgi:hypothetical protein